MVDIYKINKADGVGFKAPWICGDVLSKSFDSCSKEEAAQKLGGEPERRVVTVYKTYTPFCGYEFCCRAVFWCVEQNGILNGILANDVLSSERSLLFEKTHVQRKGDGSYFVGEHSVVVCELNAYAPTWQGQLLRAFGEEEWLVCLSVEGETVYATSVWGCGKTEILPQ